MVESRCVVPFEGEDVGLLLLPPLEVELLLVRELFGLCNCIVGGPDSTLPQAATLFTTPLQPLLLLACLLVSQFDTKLFENRPAGILFEPPSIVVSASTCKRFRCRRSPLSTINLGPKHSLPAVWGCAMTLVAIKGR